MRLPLACLVLVLLATAPAVASAAELTLRVKPADGVTLGEEHVVTGRLSDASGPLGGQLATLEMLVGGDYRPLTSATTGAEGDYRFDFGFDRNRRIRVRAADAEAKGRVSVFPTMRLTVRTQRRNVVRITQALRGPGSATIRGRTRFYLGAAKAKSGRFVRLAKVRRLHTGRYVARAEVRIPARYKGRFTYAACFTASGSSDMGDPDVRCPKASFRY